MAFSTFVVIIFVLIGYSNGDVNDIPCVEKGTSDTPTRICVNKPPNYSELQKKMDDLVEQVQNWDGFTSNHLDDNFVMENFGNEDNCGTITTVEKPYTLKTYSSVGISSHYVVQSKYFEQKINVTRCMTMNGSCLKTFTEGGYMKSSCKEKLGSISLYIYDHVNHEMVYKFFQIPVCCTCVIELENKK